MSWGIYENEDSVHVLPTDEYDLHSSEGIEGIWCKCKPIFEKTGSRTLIIHSSFDHREIIEQARELIEPNKKED